MTNKTTWTVVLLAGDATGLFVARLSVTRLSQTFLAQRCFRILYVSGTRPLGKRRGLEASGVLERKILGTTESVRPTLFQTGERRKGSNQARGFRTPGVWIKKRRFESSRLPAPPKKNAILELSETGPKSFNEWKLLKLRVLVESRFLHRLPFVVITVFPISSLGLSDYDTQFRLT